MKAARAKNARRLLAYAILFMSGLFVPPAEAASACAQPLAELVSIEGVVEVRGASSPVAAAAQLDALICPGDLVHVGPSSRAAIAFLDSDVVLRLDQNTTLQILPPSAPARSLLELIKGVIHFFSRARGLEVRTPFVNAAVEGTEFVVRVEDDRTVVAVVDGRVSMTNEKGSLTLVGSESAEAFRDGAPQRLTVRPRDAVQWALYYEPVHGPEPLDQIEQVPESLRDAAFYVRRASARLRVGRVEEARADLDQALSLSPGSGEAHALRAVIAVAQNDHEKALSEGREAVALSPDSAAAKIALSYALQATFELEAARDTLQQAVKDRPQDGLAWARLSELWLSLGDLDRAVEAAERATALAPDLARTQTVLGFAALARMDVAAARTAFEKAIALDSADPLPRLGIGLASIRQGELQAGRRDIEIAAALDPGNALIRSYLGKAYYEEKRDGLAASQYELAKDLDPLDPTPWFYDAIRKQTINRPVEALQDLRKSIELNGNRAVYRSRLMLDEDLAARSASLGRIYRDLGFQQRALVEGWKSLDADPGNYSAHRFLADTYSALPRHEVARISELLQSQLLQPLNITPLQPQLSETDLFILSHAGPSDPSFNEFNPLFARDRLALQANGIAGSNSTVGDDLVFSGLEGRISFSVGQFHYETDGFRSNNDHDRDIYNAFIQARLSHDTSVQAEFRASTAEQGDLSLLFDPEGFSPKLRNSQELDVARVGLHHAFNPHSEVIASAYYGRSDDEFTDEFAVPEIGLSGSIEERTESRGWTVEARHLYRAQRVRFTSGLGTFQADRETETRFIVEFPPLDDLSFRDEDVRQTNLYFYSLIDVRPELTLTLGVSADFFRKDLFDRDQVSPKLGLSWSPNPATTVRAAAFRTLHRSLVSSQTIEPTQVAGFNQFFDGTEGEEVWRYGIAADREFGRSLYGGAELSGRDLQVPVEGDTVVTRHERRERLGRAYVYWTPRPLLSFGAEYLVEHFDREGPTGPEAIIELTTHRLPLSMRFFATSGWTARITGTYVNQRGEFGGLVPFVGEDQFWVVDTSLSYRLPRRYGQVSLVVNNLFDADFRFQDTDPARPAIQPGRVVLLRVTLAF